MEARWGQEVFARQTFDELGHIGKITSFHLSECKEVDNQSDVQGKLPQNFQADQLRSLELNENNGYFL